ncbi:MAG: alpha/beta hydrolase [Bryobacteraceae bacterium]|nr:alpha/beta hydrolase [Bryobacteraceae bacterium]
MNHTLKTMVLWAFATSAFAANPTTYHYQKVGGVNIFYREAGSPTKPTVVLLHGYPSSSHMYRDLIPKLADRYHVIAADMPGFGYSDQPSPANFEYTFAHLTDVMDELLDTLGVKKYSVYVMDYGSPVGFRLFVKHPERIQAIISQSGNAYSEGLSPFWAEFLVPYWKERNPQTEKKARQILTLDLTKFQYSKGFRHPEKVNPDSYMFDQLGLDRPGNDEIQLALFTDYQSNIDQYPQWHAALRKAQPPVLCVWGKNDPIFIPAGAEAFRADVPKVEIQYLDTGHFALEEDLEAVAASMLTFLAKHVR